MFLGSIKGNVDPELVKQLQCWQERHNFLN